MHHAPFNLFHGKGWRFIVLGLMWSLCSGCPRVEVEEIPVPPPPDATSADATEKKPPAPSLPTVAAGDSWIAEQRLPWQAWYLQYVGNRQVGYISIAVSKGASLYRVQRIAHYRVGTAESPLQYRVELEALEYPNGRLASFTERTAIRDTMQEVSGELRGDTLYITRREDDQVKKTSIAWEEGTWGILGLQAMLMAQPMQPGEVREARMFLSGIDKIVRVELSAHPVELTTMPFGPPRELIPIEVIIDLGDSPLRTRSWVDQEGEIWKTITRDGTMASMFRVPASVAQRVADEFRYEVERDRAVLLRGESLPAEPRHVVYEVETTADLFSRHVTSNRQQVQSISALALRVETTAAPLLFDGSTMSADEFQEYVQASPLMTTDSDAVQQLLVQASGAPDLSPRQRILGLAAQVAKAIGEASAETTIRSVEDTIASGRGSEVEKALVQAAVLRAAQIPTRLAVGMAPQAELQEMRLFAWCEAWDGKVWLPIDPATGTPLAAGPISWGHDALAGDNPYAPLLAVLQLMRQVTEIRVVEAR
ncbi:MAG: hypothetical protein KatS3mg111_1732 [Pirellulaceae bacterium]|nr:MAG: hypothetical protein KatS3mg111_1732 [Pirellulaceae bacterium]